MSSSKANGPGAAATAHRAESAAFGKPTAPLNRISPDNTGGKTGSEASIRDCMGAPIFVHRKRGGGRVVVQLAEYAGARFLDFREWVEKDGELTATRKGCTMPTQLARELGEALIASTDNSSAGGLPRDS